MIQYDEKYVQFELTEAHCYNWKIYQTWDLTKESIHCGSMRRSNTENQTCWHTMGKLVHAVLYALHVVYLYVSIHASPIEWKRTRFATPNFARLLFLESSNFIS